jgi:RpiR family carbohydrate utilization transcriptional regulator
LSTTLPTTDELAPALPRIRAIASSLQPGDARVAQAILANPESIINSTVSDLAAIAETSASTVVRACQRLGFTGFHDLKLALARELGLERVAPEDVLPTDKPGAVLQKILAADADAMRDAVATVSPEAVEKAVSYLENAQRLLLVAVGTSAPLAQDAAYRLRTIGINADAPSDVHVQHVTARLLGKRDACLAISHTGSTRETVACVDTAHACGAKTVAVTSFARSPLTDAVDVALVAGSRETSFRLEAMASRLVHLSVLDALFVAIALRRPELAADALAATGEVIGEHRF